MGQIIPHGSSGTAPVNGTQLYYEVAGSGQSVVLMHGFGLDCRMWDDQFQEFASRYRVLRYDLRGFGRSSAPPTEPYAHHTDLHALLSYLGISKTHIIGLSMGGRVAIDFTLTYPEMVFSLVAVDSIVHGFKFKAFTQRPLASEAKESGVASANRRWAHHELFKPALRNPEVARRIKEIVSSYSGWHWLNKNPWTPIDPSAVQQLNKIKTPTLIVLGEQDLPDFHALGDVLNHEISTSQKVVIPGVGHMSNMEDPVAFNRIVLDFLRST